MKNQGKIAATAKHPKGICFLEESLNSSSYVNELSLQRQKPKAHCGKIEAFSKTLGNGDFLSVKDKDSGVLLHLEWLPDSTQPNLVRALSSWLRSYALPTKVRCDNTVCTEREEEPRHVEGN